MEGVYFVLQYNVVVKLRKIDAEFKGISLKNKNMFVSFREKKNNQRKLKKKNRNFEK